MRSRIIVGIRRSISAAAFMLFLPLTACDGQSNPAANSKADSGLVSDNARTSNAVVPEPVSTTTVANSDCAAFGPKGQIMIGVLKWGVPLDEAVQRLKCMDFVVGKPFGNTDLVAQRRPISHLKATLGQTTVRLTFTDVPGEERVVRVRQEANFQKSDAQHVDSIIARLVEQFGPFLNPPRSQANVYTGMIAHDVDVAEAGGDAQWPKRCFEAGRNGVDSTQACGETIIYGITTFANSDYVRSYSLSINNYRETAKAIAQAGGASMPNQAQNIAMSDGVMKRESQDIVALCSTNNRKRNFLNCQCLGDEFLKWRKKRGPQIPQYEIMKIITNSSEVNLSCVDTEEIRASITKSCRSYVRGYASAPRSIRENSESYCACVGNKVANDFSRVPRMAEAYIQGIQRNAMQECQNPEIRRQANAGDSAG